MQLLTILKRPSPPIRYADELIQISDELKRQGFTATDEDVAWAYGEFCEDRWACSWLPIDCGVLTIEQAAGGVREYLVVPE